MKFHLGQALSASFAEEAAKGKDDYWLSLDCAPKHSVCSQLQNKLLSVHLLCKISTESLTIWQIKYLVWIKTAYY